TAAVAGMLLPARRPPRPTRFPCSTLFRSCCQPAALIAVPVAATTASAAAGTYPSAAASCDASPPYVQREDSRQRPHSQAIAFRRSEEHTSELQSREKLVCRLLLEKKKMYI